MSQAARRRVTARIYRDEDGEHHNEYLVDGVAYSSLAALPIDLEG